MKIEADLSKLDTGAEVLALRVAATAILRVLPRDAAEDCVLDWAKLTGADLYPLAEVNAGEAPATAEEIRGILAEPPGEISPGAEPSEAAPSEPPGEISPTPKAPSYLEFTFDGRRFSTKKRGPRAAVDHAVKLARGCGSIAEMDAHRDALSNLCGILLEVGRQDLIDMLNEEVTKARDAIAARDDPDGRQASGELCDVCGGSGRTDNHVTGEVECSGCEGTGFQTPPDTSGDGSDIQVSETQAEPGAEMAELDTSGGGSDTSTNQDDIPFEVKTPPERRSGPPTPRANGNPEPLRELLRRARPVLGDGRLHDILEARGATTLRDLDEAGAEAVRADVLAAIEAAS